MAKSILANQGLVALTTEDERQEINSVEFGVVAIQANNHSVVNGFTMPNHNPACKEKHLLLRFAHWQRMYGILPDQPMFHVMSHGPQTTLSMAGLKDWGFIR